MARKRKASTASADTKTDTLATAIPSEKEPKTPRPNEPQFKTYPISKVNRLIEPGPVLLVSTGDLKSSTHNLMTIGFHMMVQHTSPTLLSVIIGPWDHSFAKLSKHKECVLAIPDADIAEKVVDIGNCSGEEVDKWSVFGFDALPAGKVSAPLVGGEGILANVECAVEDESLVKRFNLWVLRVVRAWVRVEAGTDGLVQGERMLHHRGDGRFAVDGEVMDLRERMVSWREFQD